MPLIKYGQIAADPWHSVADGDELPAHEPVIVSLERWRQDRALLLAREADVGVRLASKDQAADIAADLTHLKLVALEFPTFRDGRAYTTARLLRERHHFDGELRAVGNVLRDQLLFMHRCGFDAFEIDDDQAIATWIKAIDEMSVFYQPTGDGRRTVLQVRSMQRAAE
ncbi:MAG: DUF934 domain-containing protein [Rhodospirillales bacterium]|nr:DUF934 domain-containing protein [Rhodospirillales bacterium]